MDNLHENVVIPVVSKFSRCKRYLTRIWSCFGLCNCFIGCFGVCCKCHFEEDLPRNVFDLINDLSL